MGTYIYGIRSPKHVEEVELEDGTRMTVAKFAYAYKPLYSMWEPEPRWQILAKARLFRMEKIWNKFINAGGKWPQGAVAVCDDNTITEGSLVMVWPQINSVPVSVEDCTWNNAKFVGRVKRVLI